MGQHCCLPCASAVRLDCVWWWVARNDHSDAPASSVDTGRRVRRSLAREGHCATARKGFKIQKASSRAADRYSQAALTADEHPALGAFPSVTCASTRHGHPSPFNMDTRWKDGDATTRSSGLCLLRPCLRWPAPNIYHLIVFDRPWYDEAVLYVAG